MRWPNLASAPPSTAWRPSLDALEDVDAIVLANPPMRREDIIRLACARNLPLLIEKPLALDLEEASRLVAIAEAAGVSLDGRAELSFLWRSPRRRSGCWRSGPLARSNSRASPMNAGATGGAPISNDYPLVMDQPMLWEQSIHHFDLMRYVYGREPLQVQCQSWNPSWSMYVGDSNVAALFEFEGGLRVNYQGAWQGNWAAPGFEWRSDCTDGIISQREEFWRALLRPP